MAPKHPRILPLALLVLVSTGTDSFAEDKKFPLYEPAERAREKDDPEALKLFREALEARPDHIDSHIGYQRIRLSQREHRTLLLEYEKIFAENPKEPWALVVYGRILWDYDREIELYRAGLEMHPRNVDLRLALADALRRALKLHESAALLSEAEGIIDQRGDEKKARKLLEEAIDLKNDHYLVHLLHGLVCNVDDDTPAAIRSYEKSMELAAERDDVRMYTRLAQILLQRGDFATTTKILEEANEIEPDCLQLRQLVVRLYLYGLNDYERALEEAERLLDLNPDSGDAPGDAHYRRAHALLKLERNDETLASLKLATHRGGPPMSWWYVALLLKDRGEYEASLDALGRLRKISDNDEALRNIGATIEHVKQRQAEAAKKKSDDEKPSEKPSEKATTEKTTTEKATTEKPGS